ncbi:MAG: hypothetical protein JW924_04950 [Fusobacteriaceae bacterium]|nr:hypothetical protein [Fusobacteriaceae bacterium]
MDIIFRKALEKDVKKLIEVQNKIFYDDFIIYGECPAYEETEEQMAGYIKNIWFMLLNMKMKL